MVLMQPHNSLPHDDHIHVRISCPREAHSSCIELATNTPHGHTRIARKGPPGGHVLKTPPHLPGHVGRPPAASVAQPKDPLVLPQPPETMDAEHGFDVIDDRID
jgi:penicillin-insensitive murein endopeptidase